MEQNRIAAIDFARGLSLFGILLINMMSFHSPYAWIEPYTYWGDSTNRPLFILIDLFVGASFYPLFALLFGFGAVKIAEKTSNPEMKPKITLLRRFILLLGMGIIHAFFIWTGDILIMYAVTGMVFILFLNLSPKTMTIIGGLLLVIPNVLFFFLYWLVSKFVPEGELSPLNPDRIEASQLYGTGSFGEITKLRIDEWLYINEVGGIITLLILILPMVLFGAALAKGQWIQVKSSSFFRKWGVILLIPGLSIKLIPFITDYMYGFVYLQDTIGGSMVAVAYLFLCIGFIKTSPSQLVQKAIARAGKMSLTLYLTQSIIGTFIFYGYGLGLYGKVELWEGVILALAIYVAQLLFSYYWFLTYNQGPLEWLWRWFTYQKRPKFKIHKQLD